MEIKISIPEVMGLIKELQGNPSRIFEMAAMAVKLLTQSTDACLTFFNFPEEEWISLRTTNIIERMNKEFKRRTRSMEIVAGENACYRLLAFISLKMELAWRSSPIGKVRPNLPILKFIQNSLQYLSIWRSLAWRVLNYKFSYPACSGKSWPGQACGQ